jgi:hypothetical protein
MSSGKRDPADTAPGIQPGSHAKQFFFGNIKRKLTEYDIPDWQS